MAEDTTAVVEPEAPTSNRPSQKSYFNQSKLNRFFLDDEVSYIEHKPLDEGLFEEFQDLTSKIKLDREGETTEVDMALGATRKFLLENLTVGWNLVDDHEDPVQFTPKALRELPPHIIGGLVNDIYRKNPILNSEDDEEGKDN